MTERLIPTLGECAAEALATPEFVENWNRLRPEYPITVMMHNRRTAIEAAIDKACDVPPVIWSPETKAEFFLFCADYILRPVAERIASEARALGAGKDGG